MKNIFVLYTGGTIGMRESEYGLRPDHKIVHQALTPFSGSLNADWHVCTPLIDSSAVNPQNWANWLAIVEEKLPEYDGVLILHGTDTLAYTANFFALTLAHQNKPIILTGAQKPFNHPQSDAPNNLQTAINALLNHQTKEVLIAFNGKLFPAVGSSKSSTQHDDGFHNPHFNEWLPEKNISALSTTRAFNPNIRIATLFFTPTQDHQLICETLQNPNIQAAILMTFGHGNAPSDAKLIQTIQEISPQKPILNISQVPQGCVAAVYEQGNALRQAGVINAGKCNIETASVLLMLAIANHWTREDIQTELNRLYLL